MNTSSDWITTKWRPMMAVTYMIINIFDFIIGPIFYSLVQVYANAPTIEMWDPLTLGGGGLFHVAMGAVLGVAAFTRGQEKVAAIRKNKNREEEQGY